MGRRTRRQKVLFLEVYVLRGHRKYRQTREQKVRNTREQKVKKCRRTESIADKRTESK